MQRSETFGMVGNGRRRAAGLLPWHSGRASRREVIPSSGQASVGFVLTDVVVVRDGSVLLDGVSCMLPGGACTAIVGPSGAGKSTLLRLLNRMEDPSTGSVRVSGKEAVCWDALELRRLVGLVAQHPTMLAPTLLEELRLGQPELSETAAAGLLARVSLNAKVLNTSTATLSGGEAQRVCIARALAVCPEALVLDEPTASLDAASTSGVEQVMIDMVADGLTVVLVSHNVVQVRRLADHVLVMRDGRIIESGPPDNILYLAGG